MLIFLKHYIYLICLNSFIELIKSSFFVDIWQTKKIEIQIIITNSHKDIKPYNKILYFGMIFEQFAYI
jgi:hypothetical protein